METDKNNWVLKVKKVRDENAKFTLELEKYDQINKENQALL